MAETGNDSLTPRLGDPAMQTEPLVDLQSGYVQRALDHLPKQGARAPWRLHQNYVRDLMLLRFGRLAEDELEFARLPSAASRVSGGASSNKVSPSPQLPVQSGF